LISVIKILASIFTKDRETGANYFMWQSMMSLMPLDRPQLRRPKNLPLYDKIVSVLTLSFNTC